MIVLIIKRQYLENFEMGVNDSIINRPKNIQSLYREFGWLFSGREMYIEIEDPKSS